LSQTCGINALDLSKAKVDTTPEPSTDTAEGPTNTEASTSGTE